MVRGKAHTCLDRFHYKFPNACNLFPQLPAPVGPTTATPQRNAFHVLEGHSRMNKRWCHARHAPKINGQPMRELPTLLSAKVCIPEPWMQEKTLYVLNCRNILKDLHC